MSAWTFRPIPLDRIDRERTPTSFHIEGGEAILVLADGTRLAVEVPPSDPAALAAWIAAEINSEDPDDAADFA
jgi:hypothetical protein